MVGASVGDGVHRGGLGLSPPCVPLAKGVIDFVAAALAFSFVLSQVVADDHTEAVRAAANAAYTVPSLAVSISTVSMIRQISRAYIGITIT